jgi:hypothetical protein
MDKCGLQKNGEPGKDVVSKGCRDAHRKTSGQKGETVSLSACCNAEGSFLPPYSVFKGKRKKSECEDGLQPGSKVSMNETSLYVTTVFMDWLKKTVWYRGRIQEMFCSC